MFGLSRGRSIGVDRPPIKIARGESTFPPPPRMVLDLSAGGGGGVLYLKYLNISKYAHSKTDKIKNSQLLNRYLCI